jgi:hypothetical protein
MKAVVESTAFHLVMVALSWAGAVAWLSAGHLVAAALMSIAGAIWTATALLHWRNTHGRDREAEAGTRDPDHSTFTFSFDTGNYTFNAGGPITPASLAPASLSAPEPDLEVVQGDVPILAQRAARLVFKGNSEHWASLHKGGTFGVDADARCSFVLGSSFDRRHDSPAVDCHCGFYAVPCDIEPWVESGAYVTLLVELSGTVIEHEKGYRAAHQRVMECRIPPCRFCGAVASVVDVRDNAMRSACCDAHTPETNDQVLITIEDLADLLPVPVTKMGRGTR